MMMNCSRILGTNSLCLRRWPLPLLRSAFASSFSPFSNTPPFLRRNEEFSGDLIENDSPKLFVVQPRFRPEKLLQSSLREALNLANSLEEQRRDGFFCSDLALKPSPLHVVVQNPLASSSKSKAATYFGPGTVKNIRSHILATGSENDLDAVFVNALLTGTQQRNLEKAWDKPVLDRVALIIEIFHAHAYTKEAKLQSELAALMYKKSRLVRERGLDGRGTFGAKGDIGSEVVSARGRGSGGCGFISGAGETELELQRRRITERRTRLLGEIEEVRRTRGLQRASRKRRGGSGGQGLATIAVVGYTNAGKSTLVSALSDSDLYSDDRLFATVDPRLRGMTLPSGRRVLLSDTVGFISDLPVQLIEAFHATLEEVVEADLLVHVLDSSAPNLEEHRSAVLQVLKQIGMADNKIQNMIEVWNKIDVQEDLDSVEYTYEDEEEEVVDTDNLEDENNDEAGGADGLLVDEEVVETDNLEDENNDEAGGADGLLADEEVVETDNLEDENNDEADGAHGLLVDEEVVETDNLEDEKNDEAGGADGLLVSDANNSEQEQVHSSIQDDALDDDIDKLHIESTLPVKTSALTGVGLQELLERIDEKLVAINDKEKSDRIMGKGEFDRKRRPPRVKETDIAVEG